jgi:hypothetical protein
LVANTVNGGQNAAPRGCTSDIDPNIAQNGDQIGRARSPSSRRLRGFLPPQVGDQLAPVSPSARFHPPHRNIGNVALTMRLRHFIAAHLFPETSVREAFLYGNGL